MHAWAQPALPSLPGLPPIPGVPTPAAPSAERPKINDSEKKSASILAPLPVSPSPAGIVTVPEVKVPATVQGSEVVPSSATGNAASPPKPESTEMAGMASAEPSLPKPESTGLAVIAPASEMPPPALPALAPPAAPPLPPPLVIPPLAGVGEATPSTTPTVEATEKPQHKTWETKLIQPVIPKETRFQYKRILMPSEIYRTGYNRENSHLPRRVTRAEYEGLLFTSIARRDLNAMRALLNAGTNIHARNAYGETPFAFARRIGAMEVAAVLAARGGR